jgi:hypothetical protein
MIRNSRFVQHQRRLAAFLVLIYALRALIPVGFMPAGQGGLALRICPDGFPEVLLASGMAHAGHHHAGGHDAGAPNHDHKSWMSGHCVFAAATAGAAPGCHSWTAALPTETAVVFQRSEATDSPLQLRFRIAQPRAPPGLT